MFRAICLACDTRAEIENEKSCRLCKGKLQLEALCPWCTTWSSDLKNCGRCDLKRDFKRPYAVLRALVVAGVDKLSLYQRAEEMSEQDALGHILSFKTQLAKIEEKAEVFRYLERFLVGKHYYLRYVDEETCALPRTRDEAVRYANLPIPKLAGDPKKVLRDIQACGLDHALGPLAEVCKFRMWDWGEELSEAVQTLWYDPRYQKEAIAALGHPCAYDSNFPVNREYFKDEFRIRVKALFSNPLFGSWAALSFFRFYENYQDRAISDEAFAELEKTANRLVKKGLESDDDDLVFACALQLGDVDELLPYAKGKKGGLKKELAIDAVSMSGERRTLPYFKKNPRRYYLLPRFGLNIPPLIVKHLLESYQRTNEDARNAVMRLRHYDAFLKHPRENQKLFKKWFLSAASKTLLLQDRVDLFRWMSGEGKSPDTKKLHETISRELRKLKSKELVAALRIQGIQEWASLVENKADLEMIKGWLMNKTRDVSQAAFNIVGNLPDTVVPQSKKGPKKILTRRGLMEALLKLTKEGQRTDFLLEWISRSNSYLSDDMVQSLAAFYHARVADRDRLYRVLFDQRTRISAAWKGFENGIPVGLSPAKSLALWIQTEKYQLESHFERAWKTAPLNKIPELAAAMPTLLVNNPLIPDAAYATSRVYTTLIENFKKSPAVLRHLEKSWEATKSRLAEKVGSTSYSEYLAKVDDMLCDLIPKRKAERNKAEELREKEKSIWNKLQVSMRGEVEKGWDRYRQVLEKMQRGLSEVGTELQREHTKLVTSHLPPEKITQLAQKMQEEFSEKMKRRGAALSMSGEEVKAIVALFESEIENLKSKKPAVKELLKNSHKSFKQFKEQMDEWERRLKKKMSG